MTKYGDAYINEVIVRVLTRTGSQKAAYEAAGISKETFYEWLQKPDFSDLVTRARRAFAKTDLDKVEEVFRQKIIAAMNGVTEVWESEESTILPDGKVIVKKSVRSAKRGPAKWAFEIVAPAVEGGFGVGHGQIDIDTRIAKLLALLTSDGQAEAPSGS